MFQLKLCIATGWSLEYVESLSLNALNEFKALNLISPFVHDAQAHREGLIATLLYNQNVSKKKDLKSVSDLFPYLGKVDITQFDHPLVLECRQKLSACTVMGRLHTGLYNKVKDAIRAEIDNERQSQSPDLQLISELDSLLQEG